MVFSVCYGQVWSAQCAMVKYGLLSVLWSSMVCSVCYGQVWSAQCAMVKYGLL
ncbi:hypothetical protein Bpfe_001342, partial [Biomphalaria pfeifferi]